MEKKLTPYQKLKKQISELRRQLDIVCNEPDSELAVTIKMTWIITRQIENQVMMGNHNQQK